MKKIIIIGAGIIGLSIANSLAKYKYEIKIIDKGKAGKEASWAAAGMLAAQSEFEKHEELMDLCIASRELFREFCQSIEDETKTRIGLNQNGILTPAMNETGAKKLRSTYYWQKEFGSDFLYADELRQLEPNLSERVISGLFVPQDGVVDNRKLVDSLILSNKKRNVSIIEDTQIQQILIERDGAAGVQIAGIKHEADIIINCAGAWSSQFPETNFGVKPIAGQMVSLHAEKKIIERPIFSCAKEDPYIVPRENEILIGSTMEENGFKKEVRNKDINALIEKAMEIVPKIKNLKIKDTWSGFRPYTKDLMPIIGKTRIENLLIACGHGRNGILLAPITAKAIEDLVVNDTEIKQIKNFGVKRFLKEN